MKPLKGKMLRSDVWFDGSLSKDEIYVQWTVEVPADAPLPKDGDRLLVTSRNESGVAFRTQAIVHRVHPANESWGERNAQITLSWSQPRKSGASDDVVIESINWPNLTVVGV